MGAKRSFCPGIDGRQGLIGTIRLQSRRFVSFNIPTHALSPNL